MNVGFAPPQGAINVAATPIGMPQYFLKLHNRALRFTRMDGDPAPLQDDGKGRPGYQLKKAAQDSVEARVAGMGGAGPCGGSLGHYLPPRQDSIPPDGVCVARWWDFTRACTHWLSDDGTATRAAIKAPTPLYTAPAPTDRDEMEQWPCGHTCPPDRVP